MLSRRHTPAGDRLQLLLCRRKSRLEAASPSKLGPVQPSRVGRLSVVNTKTLPHIVPQAPLTKTSKRPCGPLAPANRS